MDMKLLVLLLVVSTATLVVCQESTTVKFPLDLLLPDLQAIEKYFSKVSEGVVGFVRWTQEITFTIRKIQGFLVVRGHFHDESRSVVDAFSFKRGTFYNTAGSSVSSSLELYVNGVDEDCVGMATGEDTKRQVYISYHSLDEIKQMIRPFHVENAEHSTFSHYELPSTFLANKMDSFPYLVEYTTWTIQPNSMEADGGLRVLIAEASEVAQVRTLRSIEAPQLMFHQGNDILNVLGVEDPNVLNQHVFAVRMASTGFLVENRIRPIPGVRMLSSNDLKLSRNDARPGHIPKSHKIRVDELLSKVQKVEPRYTYAGNIPFKSRPDNVVFQIRGHLMVKQINFTDETKDNVDEICPLIVNITGMGGFQYEYLPLTAICTDDTGLWRPGSSNTRHYLRGDKEIVVAYSN